MGTYTNSRFVLRTPEPSVQESVAPAQMPQEPVVQMPASRILIPPPPVRIAPVILSTSFAAADSGTITGTIVDQNGTTWINATITAVFRPTPASSAVPEWSGGFLNHTPPPVTSNTNGFFSITLPANTAITPMGSQWALSFSPDADFAATVIVLSVTPGTIDISTFITSQLIQPGLIVNAFPVPRVYEVEEARGNPPLNFGALVANTTARTIQYWDGAEWQTFGTNTGSGFVELSPASAQTIIQPPGTNFSVDTSGTGASVNLNSHVIVGGALRLFSGANDGVTTYGDVSASNNLGFDAPSNGSIIFNYAHGTGGVVFFNGAGVQVASLTSVGDLFIGGDTTVDENLIVGANLRLISGTSDGDTTHSDIIAGPNLSLNAPNGGAVIFNYFHGNGDAIFFNGAGTQVASITSTGQIFADSFLDSAYVTVSGSAAGATLTQETILDQINGDARLLGSSSTATQGGVRLQGVNNVGGFVDYLVCEETGLTTPLSFTAASKNFQIPHPLDSTKDLVHSCLEGPEIAVFYRGEASTKGGIVTIPLPDYFEVLTRKEGRTVQVTTLFDDEDGRFGLVAAGRVADGQFKVRSALLEQKFYWEVKAVRADIEPLEVVRERKEE